MLHIRFENFEPVEVIDDYPQNPIWARNARGVNSGNGWMNRNDFKSFAEVQEIAEKLTARFGVVYLPATHGTRQFDVIKAPAVGDKVSKYFNGDAYPEGEIVRITGKWQVTTSTGVKFRRQQETGSWKEVNGSFYMIGGHINERNPHF